MAAIGPFAPASRLFDVWVMVAFGVLGFALRRCGSPMVPLVLPWRVPAVRGLSSRRRPASEPA